MVVTLSVPLVFEMFSGFLAGGLLANAYVLLFILFPLIRRVPALPDRSAALLPQYKRTNPLNREF